MGQGSGSFSSAPQIVDEEALVFIRKSKGKAKRKKNGKKNLDVSKVKCFICHKQRHFIGETSSKVASARVWKGRFSDLGQFGDHQLSVGGEMERGWPDLQTQVGKMPAEDDLIWKNEHCIFLKKSI